MTKTSYLEAFLEYLSNPEYINFLYDAVAVDRYIKRAGEMFAELIKEARDNRAELIESGEDINRYFKDLNKKVAFNRKGTFKSKDTGIFHRNSGLMLGDETIDKYMLLSYINHSFDAVKDHFEELSTLVSSESKPNNDNNTSFPSFTVKHNSTAYDLHEGLVKLGYINRNLKAFYDAFTGMEVSARIQWLKGNSYLNYLIIHLCNERLINDPGNDDRWPLTMKVFVKSSNIEFKRTQLSNPSSHLRRNGVPELDSLIDRLKSSIR